MAWTQAVPFAASLICFGNALHSSRLLAREPIGPHFWVFQLQLFLSGLTLFLGLWSPL